MTGPLPLGDGAIDIHQATERAVLTLAIDPAAAAHTPAIDDEPGVGHEHHATRAVLDDSLGW